MHAPRSRLDPWGLDSHQSLLFTPLLPCLVLTHWGKKLAELEANGGTLVFHSFLEADTSNTLRWWMVSACARSVDQPAPYFPYRWLLLLWASLPKGTGKTDKQPGEMAEQVQNWAQVWQLRCWLSQEITGKCIQGHEESCQAPWLQSWGFRSQFPPTRKS